MSGRLNDSPRGSRGSREAKMQSIYGMSRQKLVEVEFNEKSKECLEWIEKILAIDLKEKSFYEALQSGEILCALFQLADPNSKIRVKKPSTPFLAAENINSFLNGCRNLGMKESSLFEINDILSENNGMKVMMTIHALKNIIQQNNSKSSSEKSLARKKIQSVILRPEKKVIIEEQPQPQSESQLQIQSHIQSQENKEIPTTSISTLQFLQFLSIIREDECVKKGNNLKCLIISPLLNNLEQDKDNLYCWIKKLKGDLQLVGINTFTQDCKLENETYDLYFIIGTSFQWENTSNVLLEEIVKQRSTTPNSANVLLRTGNSFPIQFSDCPTFDFKNDAMYFSNFLGLIETIYGIDKEKKKIFFKEPQKNVWNIPLYQSTFFGREDELKSLSQYCQPSNFQTGQKNVYIIGKSGIGKSQLVKKFVHSISNQVSCGWWINAQSESSILLSLIELSKQLNFFDHQNLSTLTIIERLKHSLSTTPNFYWILIFDNVDSTFLQQISSKYLPSKGGVGFFTTTSSLECLQQQQKINSHQCILSLLPFSQTNSCLFLESLTFQPSCSSTNDIANNLQNNPFALHQAGSYIKTMSTNFDTYLLKLQQFLNEKDSISQSQSQSPTLSLTIQLLKELYPPIISLLEVISLFSPKLIPVSCVAKNEQDQFYLKVLDSFSIINLSEDGNYFDIHSLTLYQLSMMFQEISFEQKSMYITLLIHDLVQNKSQNPEILIPHIESVVQSSLKIWSDSPQKYNIDLVTLLETLGECYFELGKYDKGKEIYLECLKIKEHLLGIESQDLIGILTALGKIYLEEEKNLPAKEYFQRSLKLLEKYHGRNDIKLADSLNSLGVALQRSGNFDESKECYELSLKLTKEHFGNESHEIVDILHNLGSLSFECEEMENAKNYFQESLQIKQQLFGKEDFHLIDPLTNLGNVLCELGEYQEAIECYTQALENAVKHYGKDQIQLLTMLTNLASAFKESGNNDQAIFYYEELLKLKEKYYGPNHLELCQILHTLGELYMDSENVEGSVLFFERELQIREKEVGEDNTLVRNLLNQLGGVCSYLGETRKSKDYYEREFRIRQTYYEKEYFQLILTLKNLGEVCLSLDELPAAESYFDQILDIYETHYQNGSYDKDRIQFSGILNGIGSKYRQLGQLKKSHNAFDYSLQLYESQFGEESTQYTNAIMKLANTYSQMNDLENTKLCYEKGLKILEKQLGDDNFQLISVLRNLGNLSLKMANIQETRIYFDRCKDLYLKHDPENQDFIVLKQILVQLSPIFQQSQ